MPPMTPKDRARHAQARQAQIVVHERDGSTSIHRLRNDDPQLTRAINSVIRRRIFTVDLIEHMSDDDLLHLYSVGVGGVARLRSAITSYRQAHPS